MAKKVFTDESLKTLVDETKLYTDNAVSSKVDKVTGKGLSTNDYTTTEKNKLSGIASGAEVNQNAFSNVKVGTTTIAADSKTDTLTLVGSNITITPNATDDSVTFTVADGSTSAKGIVQLTNSTSSESTTTAATPSSVKSAYDLANTAKTNAATAQTKADSAYTLAEGKVDSLSDLGITATAAELNYVDGVSSNIQPQLDSKPYTSDLGFVRKVTCTSSDGVAYTGTTDGVTTLTSGLTIVFISSKTSASTTPTLNINSLGAKNIKRRLSHLSTSTQAGYSTTWLYANKPYLLIYDGTQWIVDGLTKPSAADLYGTPALATKANQDGDGNVITTTYATKTEVSNLLPKVTSANNGAFLRVVDGKWAASMIDNAEEVLF